LFPGEEALCVKYLVKIDRFSLTRQLTIPEKGNRGRAFRWDAVSPVPVRPPDRGASLLNERHTFCDIKKMNL
jgi:hypothetical protein